MDTLFIMGLVSLLKLQLCFVVVQVRSCRILNCGGVTVVKQGAMDGSKAHTN